MREIYIVIFLSFSNFILAQENGLKSEELMNGEFQEWVNDTLPSIVDCYDLTYSDTEKAFDVSGLEITKLYNAKVEKGKVVSYDRKTIDDDDMVMYIIDELNDFHSRLPDSFNLHIETKTYYHPCPTYRSKYEYRTRSYIVLLHTDSFWVRYNFYRYIDGAYVYNKKTKETKYLYLEKLRGIYDKLK